MTRTIAIVILLIIVAALAYNRTAKPNTRPGLTMEPSILTASVDSARIVSAPV